MPNTFSPAQRKAALWAESGIRVYALVDGQALPGLPELLGAADVLGWDCLARGALDDEAAQRACYLVDLRDAAPFTDWLLFEAVTAFPGWGLLLVSKQPLLAMRQHCRMLSEVALPDGTLRGWRWFDPQVLRTLLPQLSPGQLDEVFLPGLALVVPAADAWTWHTLEQGLLASTSRGVAAAAAGS